MARDYDRSRLFTRRAILIGGAKLGLLSLLAGRIYYLQIIQGNKYKTLAEENRINLRLLAPPRGQILDSHGAPMAINQQNYRLVLLPEQVSNLDQLLDNINGLLPIADVDRKRIFREIRNNSNLSAVMVHDNLSWDQVAQLSLNSIDIPGTDIEVGEVRTYPYTHATSHILGYVGSVSEKDMEEDEPVMSVPGFKIGKSGVEKFYDRPLRGMAGTVQLEVNARGRVVRELNRQEPKNGYDLKLTIDIGLQQFTAQRLSFTESAAAVVVDVNTGAVKALVSHPGFDPNLFTYGIAKDDWDSLNADPYTPLLNKVVNGAYAPGSTFKPIVALAALDGDIVDPESTVFCPGHFDLGEHRFHCWKKGGHGNVNMEQAMMASCDTYFYDLGKRVGIDRIHAMARRFGMGQKLGIDMPQERSGLIPSRAWKLATRGGLWRQGETLVAAIGQGYMLTTPLQLAIMAARIANGGKAVVPRLYISPDEAGSEFPSIGIKPEHIKFIGDAMSNVVNSTSGTAYSARIVDPKMAMAGKTGTAQVRRITMAEREEGIATNESLPWKERDHALFIGYAPVSSPRYAVSVIIEHGGGGSHVAGPVARDLLTEAQKRLGV
ncbi:MAG: penicillin-binding protein 2 [Alphaproteobacteria bacterium]|nr:penicillin-binding protein 2 [Alphaproteobacteria bacterium]